MPNIYYLIRSKIESFDGQKLHFNVLDQQQIPASQTFSVNWDEPQDVSPGFSEPSNPDLQAGTIVMLALSKNYCINNGYSIVGIGKRPDYLGTDAPSGGWFTLRSLKPKSMVLETHDGTRLDLLDEKMVMPGGISSEEGGAVTLVISAAAKAVLGVAGALDAYHEGEDASGRVPTPHQPQRPEPAPSDGYAPPQPSNELELRARLSELFSAIGRVLEVSQK